MNTVRHWWVTVATLCVAALLAGEGHAWQVHVNGTFPGGYNWGKAVALDGAGNIIAGGETSNLTFVPPDFTVAKLSPLDGAEIWRFVIAGGGGALDVAVDGAGNVLAGGGLGSDGAVVKVDGATGTELWRYTMQGAFNGGYVNRIAPTQDGDVVAVETLFDTSQNAHFLVVRLASATGAEIWRRQITGLKPDSEGWSVAVDPAGDVIAAGRTEGQYQSLATIAKLDGATGTEKWRMVLLD
jgi:outer membrane protein assembly factor BamB